jgi:hypothetical protein
MDSKERNIQIGNLKKYPEFYALRLELEDFCLKLDSLEDIELTKDSRISMAEEVSGRIWARDKVKDLLSSLGLIERKGRTIDKTGE